MYREKIPKLTIPRLSLYYRALLESRESAFISSEELSKLTQFSAAQVRKDLTYFGEFGTPGKGYRIVELKEAILKILGTGRQRNIALIGAGNLGLALLAYRGFAVQGFKIVAAFDSNLSKIGKAFEGVLIRGMNELPQVVRNKNIEIAIIAVPANVAQEAVNKVIKSGITAILNFAPIRPIAPKGEEILNIDLSIELERLSYFLKRKSKKV